MEIKFTVVYQEKVLAEDIKKLSDDWKEHIAEAIKIKLSVAPAMFGKPLRRSLKGYRKLRVGDYRVVYRIEKTTVKIFMIGHRSNVYELVLKRLG